jgi:hypothetical protein
MSAFCRAEGWPRGRLGFRSHLGAPVGPGVYFTRLRAGGRVVGTEKLVVVRSKADVPPSQAVALSAAVARGRLPNVGRP